MATRKTSEQRLADANAARLRAVFDILAERGVKLGLPAKQVRAIRCALDLFELLGWGIEEITTHEAFLAESMDQLEAQAEAVAARQRRSEDGAT